MSDAFDLNASTNLARPKWVSLPNAEMIPNAFALTKNSIPVVAKNNQDVSNKWSAFLTQAL